MPSGLQEASKKLVHRSDKQAHLEQQLPRAQTSPVPSAQQLLIRFESQLGRVMPRSRLLPDNSRPGAMPQRGQRLEAPLPLRQLSNRHRPAQPSPSLQLRKATSPIRQQQRSFSLPRLPW